MLPALAMPHSLAAVAVMDKQAKATPENIPVTVLFDTDFPTRTQLDGLLLLARVFSEATTHWFLCAFQIILWILFMSDYLGKSDWVEVNKT